MATFGHIIAISASLLLQLVSSNPTVNDFTDPSFEFNADNIHSLNDEQLRALLALYDNPNFYSIPIDPEAFMSMEEIIRYHGYPIEIYKVKTADNYTLTIQRIPYGKTGPGFQPRKPVLVQHGLLCSAASWVTNVADKNLPYLLADAGYDVWLGNIRGTLYGKQHLTLSPKSKQFWAYSFDQMAEYDMPAVIDHILAETGFKQIYYVGHSMGTVMMFSLLSTQPKYNEIVRAFFALAPVARLKDVQTPLRLLAPFTGQIGWILNLLGSGEVMANTNLMKFLTNNVCTSAMNFLCENILFVACGYNPDQLNSTRVPVHLHHTPAATSVQTLVHFGQMVRSGKFHKYDHGEKMNIKVYGVRNPPEYNLKRISTRVALFWSDNDYLAAPTDVAWLAPQLENLVLKYRVPLPKFSHLDFMWATDVKPLLYNKLLETMKKLWK